MNEKSKIQIDRLKSSQEMSLLWSYVIHAEKSQHIFADNAAIQEKAGFAMIVPLTINVGKSYCCLWSTPRGLECAGIQDWIELGKMRNHSCSPRPAPGIGRMGERRGFSSTTERYGVRRWFSL